MYKSISIKNFKHLFDLKINNLNRINIIAGKNNCGKSSILEALFLFFDRGNPTAPIRSSAWRGFKTHHTTPEAMWGHLFPFYNTSKFIRIQLDNIYLQLQQTNKQPPRSADPTSTPQNTISQGTPSPSLLFEYYENKKKKILSSSYLFFENGKLLFDINNLTLQHKNAIYSSSALNTTKEDAERFSKLDQEGDTDFLVPALQYIIPDLMNLSIGIHSEVSIVQAELKNNKRKIPLYLLGGGTVKVLNILLSIASARDGIVLIDEIENGFHYSIMTNIWKAIIDTAKKYNTQLFLTTHNYELLSALVSENGKILDDIAYYRIDRNNSEKIVVVAYPNETLSSSLQSEWEIR